MTPYIFLKGAFCWLCSFMVCIVVSHVIVCAYCLWHDYWAAYPTTTIQHGLFCLPQKRQPLLEGYPYSYLVSSAKYKTIAHIFAQIAPLLICWKSEWSSIRLGYNICLPFICNLTEMVRCKFILFTFSFHSPVIYCLNFCCPSSARQVCSWAF